MRRILIPILVLFLSSTRLDAAGPLPGFRVEPIATSSGFITSLAVDSQGVIYFTTAQGDLFRLADGAQRLVATFPTAWEGNAGLLGVALLSDEEAVVHYTSPGRWQHVIAKVELGSGKTSDFAVMQSLPPGEGGEISTEHHGGNLTVDSTGTIWFGIGDFGGFAIAQKANWIAGKLWRIGADGVPKVWASGLRNPYDLAWDPVLQRVVVGDNGSVGNDEVHVVAEGDDCGWPNPVTPEGKQAVPPVFVFPRTVAPTGLLRVNGKNPIIRRGYIVAAFVTRSLYYFPSITSEPADDPVTILDRHEAPIIDVADGPDGTVYFTTGAVTSKIWRLDAPKRGDCDGDGLVTYQDLDALAQELAERESQPMISVAGGAHAGSWGCDANADGVVTAADAETIRNMVTVRRRSVGRR